VPYNQYTLAQLRGFVQNRLGEMSGTFWRTDELNRYIQLGLRLYNLLTGYWKGRATLQTTVVSGVPTVWYSVAGTFASTMRVSWQGYPLSPASGYDLDFGRPQWESETTTSGNDVPTRPTLFVIGATNLIGIWPADAAGGSAMTIDGILTTPVVTVDASPVDFGQEELSGFLDVIQLLAAFKQSGREFTDSAELFKAFLKSAGERNGILMKSAIYRKWMGFDRSKKQRPFRASQEQEVTGAR